MTEARREIFCLIQGDSQPINAEVSRPDTTSVSHFKRTIREERQHGILRDTDPADLIIWKLKKPLVFQPEDTLVKRTLDYIGDPQAEDLSHVAEKLLQNARISQVFPEKGLSTLDYLHVFVQRPMLSARSTSLPGLQGVIQRRTQYSDDYPNMAPSALGIPSKAAEHQVNPKRGPAFYFSRPLSAALMVPLTLLHPVFAEFQDNCMAHTPSAEDNAFAVALSEKMSQFYPTEALRMEAFRKVMMGHGIDMKAATVEGTSFITDGCVYQDNICYCLAEGKNEIGSTGAEPIFQGGHYYHRLMAQLGKETGARLPMFLLYLVGPHLGFVGVALTDRPNMQVLVPALPLFWHCTDIGMRATAARYLGALKTALKSLMGHYEKFQARVADPLDHPDFPYQHHYNSLTGDIPTPFQYVAQVYDNKLVFSCTQSNDGRRLFVKFTHTYSKDAHLKCAELGIAPDLKGFQQLAGGWYMVVMDDVRSNYVQFRSSLATPSLLDSIQEYLTKLHQQSLVHGDVRDVNILVAKGTANNTGGRGSGIPGFMLCDFDWAGTIGEARYPMNLNRGPNLWRPDEALDGQLIKAEHDLAMLDRLRPSHVQQ